MKRFALEKINYIMIAVAVVIIIAGFLLMTGPGSNEVAFEPSIFSARRIKVAPVVCLIGFVSMIVAIMYHPKDKNHDMD